MMNLKGIIFLSLFIPAWGIAQSSMKSNFDEGRGIAKSASSQNQQINANDIIPNVASPKEASLYTGQDANPQLNSMGTQALQSSEIGQLLTTSSVNNPADTISPESDMIKRSDNIIEKADFLTGGVGGKQCIKQELSKSHFTNHFCEKDQEINKTCKITTDVKISGSKHTTQEEIILTNVRDFGSFDYAHHIRLPNGRYVNHPTWLWKVPLVLDFDAKITKMIVESARYGTCSGYWRGMRGIVYNGNEYFRKKETEQSYCQIEIPLNIDIRKGISQEISFWGERQLRTDSIAYRRIIFSVEKVVNTLKADLVYKNSCQNEPAEDIKISEKCTSEGGYRNFIKNGESIRVHSDCWEKTLTYLVNDASDNECKKYDDNPNCTVGERECISSLNGLCNRFKLKYQCQHTTKTDGVVCGDKFFCSDGSCADLEDSKNQNFGHAVSQLASLAQAGKDVSLDSQNLRAFTGRPMACRKSGFGFSDCCKDSGWGHKAGLAQCNSEENVLGKAKEKKVVIYVGTYCDKKVLKKCIRKKSSYCVFDNKLARIVQYQGRSGQLGIGFGGAKHPDCRGISVDELQRIDFNAMDYSDFYEDLEKRKDMPNQDKIIDYIKKNISSQMQQ